MSSLPIPDLVLLAIIIALGGFVMGIVLTSKINGGDDEP